jgi:hypothetical protein
MSEITIFQPFFAFIGSKDFVKTCEKNGVFWGHLRGDNYYI